MKRLENKKSGRFFKCLKVGEKNMQENKNEQSARTKTIKMIIKSLTSCYWAKQRKSVLISLLQDL